jgi:hypothetical protein
MQEHINWLRGLKDRPSIGYFRSAEFCAAALRAAACLESLSICPHCGEAKPTPHVLVLSDDPYCEECWAELCESSEWKPEPPQ